jgi:hypothetical protein
MLGIPLFQSRPRDARSETGRRSSLTSLSATSHRSTPTSSPARHPASSGGRLQHDSTCQFKTVKRGSSTPGSIDGSNRRESSKMTTTRTGKFNLKNLLAKLAGGKLKDSPSPEHQRHHHHHLTSVSSTSLRRSKPDDLQSDHSPRSVTLCRRSMSQPDQHKARSLSASGTGSGLRRAKINDSNTSVGSAVSQYYPTAVACRRQAAAVAAAAAAATSGRQLSPSSAGPSSVIGIECCDDQEGDDHVRSLKRGQRIGSAGTAPPSLHMSLRSSAASVLTADWSMPGSASSNSLGSVFSTSSHSTPWTPFSGAASDSGIRGWFELTLINSFFFCILHFRVLCSEKLRDLQIVLPKMRAVQYTVR